MGVAKTPNGLVLSSAHLTFLTWCGWVFLALKTRSHENGLCRQGCRTNPGNWVATCLGGKATVATEEMEGGGSWGWRSAELKWTGAGNGELGGKRTLGEYEVEGNLPLKVSLKAMCTHSANISSSNFIPVSKVPWPLCRGVYEAQCVMFRDWMRALGSRHHQPPHIYYKNI